MNQNLSLKRLKRRFGRFRLLWALVVMLSISFYCGFWIGERTLSRHHVLVETQKQRLELLYRQSDLQIQKINFLEVEMEIEKQATDHVKTQVTQLHQHDPVSSTNIMDVGYRSYFG